MTREEILLAAAQIIREKGFHATSMQDIAQAVDLRKASLYYHINSKQEILVDLLDQGLGELNKRLKAVCQEDLPSDEKFRKALRSYLNYMAENLEISAVLLLEHRSLAPEYKARHIPLRDQHETYWEQIIEEGVKEGIFAVSDVRLAVKAVLGVANWTVMWLNPDGRLSANDIADSSADLLLGGFYCREGN